VLRDHAFSYDPIERAIEIQLGGTLSERPHNPENLIIRALDLKYHASALRYETVWYLALEGYIQKDIAELTGISQQRVSQIIRSVTA
jgi:predicted XRE-type DNA-binding protein